MSETVNECSAARGCSTAGEINSSLADLRTTEAAIRDEPYKRLPALAGMLAIAAHRLELTHERMERLESLVSFALTVETTNTPEWMIAFQGAIDKALAADCDHRRCTFDNRQLRLRSIRNVSP